MVRREKISHAASLFLAALIGVVTVGVVAHAAQSITTPNAMQIPYSLAFSGQSTPITLPVNQPVLVMGSDSDFAKNGNSGLGQAIMNSLTSDGAVHLVAFDESTITLSSSSARYGIIIHVFYLDRLGYVDVRTDGQTIWVFNGDDQSSGAGIPIGHTGVVKMIW